MLKKISLGLLAGLALASCGSLNLNQANIRIIHASPDAGAVDVYVGSKKLLTNVTYTQASAFSQVDPGNLIVKICPTSAATTPPANCPIDTTNSPIVVTSGNSYTIVAVGTVANGTLQALVAPDDLTAPQSGQFRLRVIHAAPAATPVDVYATTPTTDLSTAVAAVSSFTYKSITVPYIGIPAGSYRFRITTAGTKNVLIDSGTTGFPLSNGKIYTAIAVNPVANVTNGLILLIDN